MRSMIFRTSTEADAGDGYSAEVQQFRDRLLTPPAGGSDWDNRYRGFIDGLVADGVWSSKLDCLVVTGAADEGSALTDLLNAECNWQAVAPVGGQPTWAANVGYDGRTPGVHGPAASIFLDDGGLNYSQASACIFAYADFSTQLSVTIFQDWDGATAFGDYVELYPLYANTHTYASLNKSEVSLGTNLTSLGKHFYLLNLSGGLLKLYEDGVELASVSWSPTALQHLQIIFKGFPGIALCGFGAGLTPTQAAAISTRVATLAAEVGW